MQIECCPIPLDQIRRPEDALDVVKRLVNSCSSDVDREVLAPILNWACDRWPTVTPKPMDRALVG
jgi:hypothetical protein